MDIEKAEVPAPSRDRKMSAGSYGTFLLKCGRTDCSSNMSAFEQCYHIVEELEDRTRHDSIDSKASRYSERSRLISTRHSSISIMEAPNPHCHRSDTSMPDNSARNTLMLASIVCLVFTIGEAVGGYLANSLAIMTDASHMLSDFASFLISLFALWVARRPATQKMSFGWYRAEIMGAVCSVLIIWVLTGVLVYLAIGRVVNQNYTIDANTMLITASAGVAVNIIMGILLHQGGHGHSHGLGGGHGHSHGGDDKKKGHGHSHDTKAVGHGHSHDGKEGHGHSHGDAPKEQKKEVNINVRAAFIHVIGDLVQSIGVLIAAIIIKFQPTWVIADPICTFVFSILVLFTTLTILRDALHVLMEGFPRDISYPSLVKDLCGLPGVQTIHSLHVWSLTVDKNALSVHLAIDPDTSTEETLVATNTMLRENYNIFQTTIQVEHYQPAMENCKSCKTPGI